MRGGVTNFLQNEERADHLIKKKDHKHHDHRFLIHDCVDVVAKYDDDDDQESCNSIITNDDEYGNLHAEEVDHDEDQDGSLERAMYWESQEALLEEILDQYKSSYSKLREELSRHVEFAKVAKYCECLSTNLDDCSHCLRKQVLSILSKKGFNATLCISSWKKTHSIPAGKHEYIEVVVSSQGRKRKVKFLIEIEFRDEFKMAKACNEYQSLVNLLPETYIGKAEHLNAVLRVMCDAAKRSTAEKKIHLGPWRTRSFMQMKWSASSSSSTPSPASDLVLKEEEKGIKLNLSAPGSNRAVRVA